MMDLNHKNIILTGASSGIGLALLNELKKHQCRIIAVSRSIDQINIIDNNIIKYPCDISVPENIDKLLLFAKEKLGSIDIFIANAGFTYYGLTGKPDWQKIESIYRTNVFSSIYSAEKMKELCGDRAFRVVITASAMSFLSYPGYTIYSSTKAALHGFAAGYRIELGKNQKITLAYPIATRTNFFREAGENTPIPWPSQTPKKVAMAIIRGIKKNKNSIFPSKIFLSTLLINRYLPFVFSLIIFIEKIKFYRWLRGKEA
jgi:short-subunit dehydrogenase